MIPSIASCRPAVYRALPDAGTSPNCYSHHTVGTHEQPYIWHPWLYHYGRNWKVPGDGIFTLRVRFNAPTYQPRPVERAAVRDGRGGGIPGRGG